MSLDTRGWPTVEGILLWTCRTSNFRTRLNLTIAKLGKDYARLFPLRNTELTALLLGQESYTYDILVSHAQGRPQPRPHAPSPPQPHHKVPFPPPYVPQPPPHQPKPDPETIWDLQSIGQAIGRIEETQREHRAQVGDFRRLVGSLDQKVGYVERNTGRKL